MNLNVYYNKAADQAALKKARQEMDWKQDEVNRLELAVEFGRCLKCKAALDTMTSILCDDCNDEVDNPKPDTTSSFDKIVEDGLKGSTGPGPHLTGNTSLDEWNQVWNHGKNVINTPETPEFLEYKNWFINHYGLNWSAGSIAGLLSLRRDGLGLAELSKISVVTFGEWASLDEETRKSLYKTTFEPSNDQKHKDLESRVKQFNQMVVAGMFPGVKKIDIDFMTSYDINKLWHYLPA